MKKLKKKVCLYKEMLVEILETLCSICLYLERAGIYTQNQYRECMRSHFTMLKKFSRCLMEELPERKEE